MPRHPPCALHSLSQQRQNKSLQKMLASTMQISNNNPTNPHPPHQQQADKGGETNPPHPNPPPDNQHRTRSPRLMNQDPTACHTHPPRQPQRFHTNHTHTHPTRGQTQTRPAVLTRTTQTSRPSSTIPPTNTTKAGHTLGDRAGRVLLRKEVIQPHLPVRLPCYDFVPIASPTFDGSLHKGWATGFGCCRLS